MGKRRVLVTNLAPFRGPEQIFFRRLLSGFEKAGCECLLWSAVYDWNNLSYWHIPSHWRLKNWPYLLKGCTDRAKEAMAQIDVDKWQPRFDILPKQELPSDLSRRDLMTIVAGASLNILECFEPDLVLSWNQLCPHTGICADLARSRGVDVMLLERGIFPNSWYLETGGLLGHSILAGRTLDSLVSPQDAPAYRQMGLEYLKKLDIATFNSYAQNSAGFAKLQDLTRSFAKRIAFFPPDDSTLGFLPTDTDDRRISLPGYANSFEAAKALAASTKAAVIFKRHPSATEQTYDTTGYPNLFVSDVDFRALIEWSDATASTGSGLGFIAMAKEKPLISMARDWWSGKGIAYDASREDDLAGAATTALARKDLDNRLRRYHEFVGYLMGDYLVSLGGLHPHFRSPEMAASQATSTIRTPVQRKRYSLAGACHEICSPSAHAIWRVSDSRHEELFKKTPPVSAEASPDQLLSCMRTCAPDQTMVVDFDHTLFLGNSTELFIWHAHPRAMAYLIDNVCARLFRGICFDSKTYGRWRDFIRVSAIVIFMPWTLLSWRRAAGQLMDERLNRQLHDAVKNSPARETVIASLGFSEIIQPLLDAAYIPGRLIASRLLRPWKWLRRVGKAKSVERVIGTDALTNSVVVTDSYDDADMLQASKNGWLVQWKQSGLPPEDMPPAYIPLRYTAEGKYPGKDILWNQHFGEDFMVCLLAYSWTWANWPVALFLFLAVFAVYEIGYHENDFVAAKSEAKPTLSPTHQRFAQYPIWQAWLWAMPLILIAAFWLPGLFWTNVLIGGASLLAVRLIFWIYNCTDSAFRIWVYPLLQIAKTGALLPLVGASPAGVLLIVAQIMRQVTNYNVYRTGGDTSKFRRQTHRLIVFGMAAILALLVGIPPSQLITIQFGWILAWIFFRLAREKYGPLPNIWTRVAASIERILSRPTDQAERLVIYGAGISGEKAYSVLASKNKVVCFLDDDKGKIGQQLNRLPIYSPTELPKIHYDRIVIACHMYYEMLLRLRENGVSEKAIVPVSQARELIRI